MILEFFIPCIPVAKGRPKFARRGKLVKTYTPAKTRHAERDFLTLAMENRPETPESIKARDEFFRLKKKLGKSKP